jgi:hypothetical protein
MQPCPALARFFERNHGDGEEFRVVYETPDRAAVAGGVSRRLQSTAMPIKPRTMRAAMTARIVFSRWVTEKSMKPGRLKYTPKRGACAHFVELAGFASNAFLAQFQGFRKMTCADGLQRGRLSAATMSVGRRIHVGTQAGWGEPLDRLGALSLSKRPAPPSDTDQTFTANSSGCMVPSATLLTVPVIMIEKPSPISMPI